MFRQARAEGRREPAQAYAADALVALARGGPRPGPRAVVHVAVDHAALARGHVEAGERCEIPGVGSVPVATARALAADAVLEGIVTKGTDVVAVAHLGRTVTAAQRRALEARDPVCVVEGCEVREHLEIDHVDGWALTRTTTLARLARLCRWHHHLKTYCGYRLDGTPGNWRWTAPEEPAGG
ncbi:MAG: HNH endonuclease [Actinobacteria bacterium]|nr:HNH endonuclease [Actinomycetota bacterium]